MGGMEGFGPIDPEPETQEPVFHAPWEGRVYGMNVSLGFLRLWNIDQTRHSLERLKPTLYLRPYYERWFAGIESRLMEHGLVTTEEMRTGKELSPVPSEIKDRALKAEMIGSVPLRVRNYTRQIDAEPRFKPGDRVRTVNRHPHGHTREPRYLRGRVGTIHEHYGAQVFPDVSARGIDQGEHLYAVRFEASELWGESADPRSAVYADLWEPYLEPAK
jgi:nitrile hydratase